MSILDELDRKISKIGREAVKKTKEVSESVKVSASLKEEEDQIKELYLQIGEYCYSNRYAAEDRKLQELYASTDQRKQTIVAYQEQLRKLKKMVTCPNCGTDNPNDALFCTGCGTKLEKQVEASPNTVGKVCSSCGKPIGIDQVFCTNCGEKQTDIPVQVSEPVKPTVSPVEVKPVQPKPVVTRESVVEDIPEVEIKEIVCRNCGTKLEKGLKFCTTCGASCEPKSSVCPSCGKTLKPDQKFCTGCGTKV